MMVKYTYQSAVIDKDTGEIKKPVKPPLYHDKYKEMITKNILQRYKRDNIVENSTDKQQFTSFITGKGKLIALCLRDNMGTGKHHDLELLKFVALHELAHIANSIPGTENHGPEFWRTFKILLLEARENNLCTILKTEKGHVKYCNDLVLYDHNLNLDNIKL